MPSLDNLQILVCLESLTARRAHIKNIQFGKEDKTTLVFKIRCIHCGRDYEVKAPLNGIAAWMDDQKIQHALPMLNANERELLLTGTCSSCWEDIFIDAEDDVEPEGEPE